MSEPRYEMKSDANGLYIFDTEDDRALIMMDIVERLNTLVEKIAALEFQQELLEHSGGYGV